MNFDSILQLEKASLPGEPVAATGNIPFRGIRILVRVLREIVFPQACCLCGHWTSNPGAVPLCLACRDRVLPRPEPICPVCGVTVPGSLDAAGYLCSTCRSGATPWDILRSWAPYEGDWRRLVRAYKFRGYKRLARFFAECLTDLLRTDFATFSPDALVPIPLHPQRIQRHGFDPPGLLAEALSAQVGLPVRRLLIRRRPTHPQTGLSLASRRRNLAGAFALCPGGETSAAARPILVDDVITTGTTLRAALEVLRQCPSVQRVGGLAVARTPRYF